MNTPSRHESAGISCLMPFYGRDDPAHFEQALASVLAQTRPPDEIVLVQDGPAPQELVSVATAALSRHPGQLVRLDDNQGLGRALARGVQACRHDLVARMDADDLCRPDRFARQEALMRADGRLAIVGTAIAEFAQVPGDLAQVRRLPAQDLAIRRHARLRNPFNHMTVMFRRAAVIEAGNYRHTPSFEDYDLWLRLLRLPVLAANLDDPLVDARVGNGMLARRRGMGYARAEWAFLRRARDEGLLSMYDVGRSALLRLPVRLAPAGLIARVYQGLRGRH